MRLLRRLVLLLLVLTLLAAAPAAVIETTCRSGPARPTAAAPIGLTDPGYARPETNSYLSYPEWAIVYAYQDLAGVMHRADEGAFDYSAAIAGYWRDLCGVTGVAAARGGGALDEKVMLYVIGLSFTAEMAIKGGYETTIGRLAAWWRGPVPTPEDRFASGVADEYAAFLQQTPWYEYPFAARLAQLWRAVPFGGSVRSVERRAALSMEWGGKAVYARGMAALAGLSPAEERIGSVVQGLDAADVAADPRIAIRRNLPNGATLIETPRYGAFTEIVAGLAARDRTILEIAGNRAVLVTALAKADAPPFGPPVLFADPLQARPGWRRLGLDVAVPELTALVRRLREQGAEFEHVYDY